MNFPTMKALVGTAAAVTVALVVMTAPQAVSVQLVSALALVAVAAAVAFSTQVGRLRDRERLVYRPVYVRRHPVQQRVRSTED